MNALARVLLLFLLLLPLISIACGSDSGGNEEDGGTSSKGEDGGSKGAELRHYEEQVVLYLTNRVRMQPSYYTQDVPIRKDSAPAATWPLWHHEGLWAAARWQAEHIDTECSLCEDHTSCCDLAKVDGQVECIGPIGGCGGTGPGARVALWTNTYSSENAASGPRSGERAVLAWIMSTGHWNNMNRNHELLGVGQAGGKYVQDFGKDGSAPPVASDGIHFRRMHVEITGFGSTISFESSNKRIFGINYYAPGLGAPSEIYLEYDGVRSELSLSRGSADQGSYEVELHVSDVCNSYQFHIVDSNDVEHRYPATGSLPVAADMSNCP